MGILLFAIGQQGVVTFFALNTFHNNSLSGNYSFSVGVLITRFNSKITWPGSLSPPGMLCSFQTIMQFYVKNWPWSKSYFECGIENACAQSILGELEGETHLPRPFYLGVKSGNRARLKFRFRPRSRDTHDDWWMRRFIHRWRKSTHWFPEQTFCSSLLFQELRQEVMLLTGPGGARMRNFVLRFVFFLGEHDRGKT